MAAVPTGVLLALGLPSAWRDQLLEIADGVGDAVRAAGTVIRGGNVSAAQELSITTTVLGAVFRPLVRSGASVGDTVYVTGWLGGPRAALDRLASTGDAGPYRERFAHPVARMPEARWLAAAGASAAIDISDGLAADLRHLAAASNVRIRLDVPRLPCVDGVTPDEALVSGEEYELLVTTPVAFDTAQFEQRFALPLTPIGQVVSAGVGDVEIIGAGVAGVKGHDHLS
jgi:thiamine-monophosphate kinase